MAAPWACLAALVLVPPVVYQTWHLIVGYHDAGNYGRAIYNVLEHGRLATFSDGSRDFFSDQHFEPFLFLLTPIVRLFGVPGYVGAVTMALLLGAEYVFALGAAVGKSPTVGALCAIAYIANPYTYSIALSYHPETFAILFLLAFAYYSYVGRTMPAGLMFLLALIVKEDIWIYAVVTALLVARRDRIRQTAACVAVAVAYYLVAVRWIGGSLYPEAHYFNSFYTAAGHMPSKVEIVRTLIGRWREFLPLLFTGPGLLFQITLLCVTAFSPWRYAFVCGVMLLWLSYPGGPPRSTFAYYYSYPALLLSFVTLPFALANLRAIGARLVARGDRARSGLRTVSVVMGFMIAVDLVMHVPGYVPVPIGWTVDYRSVFGRGPGVNYREVRRVIARYLTHDTGSVLSQFFTFQAVPQRREMYLTLFDYGRFLNGDIQPTFVLLDLGADDPYVPRAAIDAMALTLRSGGRYRRLSDRESVLLYRRVGGGGP